MENPDRRSYTAESLEDWRVITRYDIDRIMERLDVLYQSVPLQSAGYVLDAIDDIEAIFCMETRKSKS